MSTLILPGDFEEGKSYVLTGKTLKAWQKNLLADRVLAGVGITENPVPTGRFFSVDPAAAALAIPLLPFQCHSFRKSAGAWRCQVKTGWVLAISPAVDIDPMAYTQVTAAELTISTAHTLYCIVHTDASDLVTSATLEAATSTPASAHAQPDPPVTDPAVTEPPAVSGVYAYRIADFELNAAGMMVVKNQYQVGAIIHRPGRNGRTGTRIFQDCDAAEIARIQFIQGQIVSTGTATIESGCGAASSS